MMYGTVDKMIIAYRYFTPERLRAKIIKEVMKWRKYMEED